MMIETTIAADRLSLIAAALTDAGYTCREWKGQRVYVKLRGRDLGYLTAEDDGSTGTCRHVERRGDIAVIIRVALAA